MCIKLVKSFKPSKTSIFELNPPRGPSRRPDAYNRNMHDERAEAMGLPLVAGRLSMDLTGFSGHSTINDQDKI
jgi:hypothetical protein